MEEKTIITNAINAQIITDKYLIFEWKCLEQKSIGVNKLELRFARDDSVSYINELRKLEEEYGDYKVGTMLPTFILPGVSMALFTAFIIVFFINRDHFDFLLFFLTLVLPAIICLALAFLFMLLRSRTIAKIDREKPEKDREFREKVRNLK